MSTQAEGANWDVVFTPWCVKYHFSPESLNLGFYLRGEERMRSENFNTYTVWIYPGIFAVYNFPNQIKSINNKMSLAKSQLIRYE